MDLADTFKKKQKYTLGISRSSFTRQVFRQSSPSWQGHAGKFAVRFSFMILYALEDKASTFQINWKLVHTTALPTASDTQTKTATKKEKKAYAILYCLHTPTNRNPVLVAFLVCLSPQRPQRPINRLLYFACLCIPELGPETGGSGHLSLARPS